MGRRFAFVLAALLILPQSVVPAAAAPTSPSFPRPATLPPPAPTPTSTGRSPEAPDPHPPLGGIGPDGLIVGGPELISRGLLRPAGTPKLPARLTARAFVLVDLGTGDILAARDPHGRYQPASILKTLTALVLLPKLPGSRVIRASRAAANAEGSAVGLVPGGKYTVNQLFASLLLMSGNDAATALAEAAGGVQRTVADMNAMARRLGAYDTFVQTPSGLDGWKQLTSAYDMALVLQAAVNSPRLVAYDRTITVTLPPQHVGARKWGRVPLWNQSENFLTGVRGAVMAKTGFTDAAQHTYLCAARRGNRTLGVVFLRAKREPLDQWQQASRLLDWGFRVDGHVTPVGRLTGAVSDAQVRAAASPTPSASTAAEPTAPSAHPGGQARGAGSHVTSATTIGLIALAIVFGLTSIIILAFVRRGRRP